MPTLTDDKGKPIEVTAPDAAAVNAQFERIMDADPAADEAAPPKRQPRPADPGQPAKRRGRPPKTEQARTTTAAAAPARLGDGERATGVAGLVQLGAGLLAMAAKATGNVALLADATTVINSSEAITTAVVDTARVDQRFAAVIDRICSTGPYAALISVGVQVGMQCVRNHRPGMSLPGTVHPDDLLRMPGEPAVSASS